MTLICDKEAHAAFDTKHKEKCRKCIYRTKVGGGKAVTNWGYFCQYILIEGHRRPCPANACTVFVEGPAKRTPAGEYYIHNLG